MVDVTLPTLLQVLGRCLPTSVVQSHAGSVNNTRHGRVTDNTWTQCTDRNQALAVRAVAGKILSENISNV